MCRRGRPKRATLRGHFIHGPSISRCWVRGLRGARSCSCVTPLYVSRSEWHCFSQPVHRRCRQRRCRLSRIRRSNRSNRRCRRMSIRRSRFRKQAAQAAERVPGKAAPATGAEQSVRARQDSLADALRTKVRPNAKQGDLFTAPMAAAIKAEIQKAVQHAAAGSDAGRAGRAEHHAGQRARHRRSTSRSSRRACRRG